MNSLVFFSVEWVSWDGRKEEEGKGATAPRLHRLAAARTAEVVRHTVSVIPSFAIFSFSALFLHFFFIHTSCVTI